MGLLNFIDTGFIIILAILLLISGGIMFYCYRRLNLLEESIINQGKILQNLIINLQNNNGTNEQINQNLNNNNSKFESNKIDVSDDEESLETGYDEICVNDEDSQDEESENQENELTKNINPEINLNNENNIKSIVLNNNEYDSDNESSDNESSKSLTLSDNIEENDSIDIDNDILEQSLMNISLKEDNDKNLDNDVKVLELSNDVLDNINDETFINNLNTSNDEKKNEEKKSDNKIKGLNKMKLDDLKQLVIDKNINLEEDINSMKKADLIKILSN